jgi:filamentous hemagglutinin
MSRQYRLLEGETRVGAYGDLIKLGRRGDNLTPHHVPADAYMKAKIKDYLTNQGVAIMMEHFSPGRGGRHRLTASYGKPPNLQVSPRTTLAHDIRDLQIIYQRQNLYNSIIKSALNNLIALNKHTWKHFFNKHQKRHDPT